MADQYRTMQAKMVGQVGDIGSVSLDRAIFRHAETRPMPAQIKAGRLMSVREGGHLVVPIGTCTSEPVDEHDRRRTQPCRLVVDDRSSLPGVQSSHLQEPGHDRANPL